jgi:hypothetical protein
MLEGAFIWLVEESLLVYAGLTFALLGLACEPVFGSGAVAPGGGSLANMIARVSAPSPPP